MKTSKMMEFIKSEKRQDLRRNINKTGIDKTYQNNPDVYGALVHFKDTDKKMDLFFNFTTDTISIDYKTDVPINCDNINMEFKKIEKDYTKIKDKLKPTETSFTNPILNFAINLDMLLCKPEPWDTVNFHVEKQRSCNGINVFKKLLDCHDNDIKDISFFTKHICFMPEIYRYTAKECEP